VIILVNMSVQAFFRQTLERFVAPMTALPALMNAAQRLAALDHPGLEAHAAALDGARRRLGRLDRYARRFVQELNGNEMVATVVGYANLLFLLDLNAFVFGIARVRRHRDDLSALFESIGFLDAACSVARFRESLPAWCAPSFVPAGKRIDGRGLYHPLLTSPVANDLRLDGQDLVVTGSNMAGKTTYLRAAGVATVLAQAIATVPAESWTAPLLQVATLITRNDDLAQGKSYFLVEAEIVHDLLRCATSAGQHLFIMDEIFRGTNTRERLSASAAVLHRLSRGDDICLVATHDVELEHLLDGDWAFWHFQESVGEGGVDFDYHVRPGVSSTPNALRLLEASGYPRDLIEDAFANYTRLGGPTGSEDSESPGMTGGSASWT
jgi:DNA mismatch repair ATPase MutS